MGQNVPCYYIQLFLLFSCFTFEMIFLASYFLIIIDNYMYIIDIFYSNHCYYWWPWSWPWPWVCPFLTLSLSIHWKYILAWLNDIHHWLVVRLLYLKYITTVVIEPRSRDNYLVWMFTIIQHWLLWTLLYSLFLFNFC